MIGIKPGTRSKLEINVQRVKIWVNLTTPDFHSVSSLLSQ